MIGPDGWWAKLLAFISLAGFGGLLGYLMRSIDTQRPPTLFRAVVEALSSAFAGLLFYLLCQWLNFGLEATGLIVGVAGWMGASASIMLLDPLVRKLVEKGGAK